MSDKVSSDATNVVAALKEHTSTVPHIEGEAKLDEAAQSAIGRQLRAVYSEIVQQPVPDQFLRLLEDLERKEEKR